MALLGFAGLSGASLGLPLDFFGGEDAI